jgi:hypothetical protein
MARQAADVNPFTFPYVYQCPLCGRLETVSMYSTYVPRLICGCRTQYNGPHGLPSLIYETPMVRLSNETIDANLQKYREDQQRESEERAASHRRAQEELDSWG